MALIKPLKRIRDFPLKEYKKRRKDQIKTISKNKDRNFWRHFYHITYKKVMDIVRSYLLMNAVLIYTIMVIYMVGLKKVNPVFKMFL